MTLLAEIALVVVAAVAVVVSVAFVPRASPGRRRAAVPIPRDRANCVANERLVVMARTSALQVHAYLRPVLVEIATQRLVANGQALDRMSDVTGRRILGDDLWEIVRLDRGFPEDRHGPGVNPQTLEAMLDVLERL